MKKVALSTLAFLGSIPVFASEADLKVPESIKQHTELYYGFAVTLLGMLFGLYQYTRVRKLPAHKSMLEIGDVIYKTCKAYLKQQGRFLAILFVFIGAAVAAYYGFLAKDEAGNNLFGTGGVLLILTWTVVGILGSYAVAAFGIRMNTLANSRMAFASLKRKPLDLLNIPLNAGMSIGVLLICVELMLMLIILLLMPGELAGACFIGFAIGESLGASALRIAGGIFTKIADIGSDLMKVVFKIGEDDPRNPGVIADCTGDNAGDSVGPTADGFETYGVTGVALISFILLAITSGPEMQTLLLAWIFVMRILMVITSVVAFWINKAISNAMYSNKEDLDFEAPLTHLVWITSILSIIVTFIVSYLMLPNVNGNSDMWWILSVIISCGTLGAALIPEFTKIFTSPKSSHVREIVNAGQEGGASLVILSGFVAGNFSAFWKGLVFFVLMFAGYYTSTLGLADIMIYPSVFAFGLIAFGMLGMGPVTIAVDSYGPVTDNAQSVYELSLIEEQPGIDEEIQRDFGFRPDWEKSKYYLEANDGAGNTFKATAKPVLIGTAVVGATTMIFSLILMIEKTLGVDPETILNVLNPYTILGFLLGGSVIYWFTGASTQAVTTGAYRAVEYIKRHINLDPNAPKKADPKASVEVVKICTQYAQNGMFNIFIAIFFFALAFACISSPAGIGGNDAVALFVSYLIGIAVFGLFQAIFMANAGGAWDNAKKVVEVDLKAKGTPLHDATVVGDTVGDPFKDTSSVSLNPIIKFTTLFGLLAMEMAISESFRNSAPWFGLVFLVIALVFSWRSFYKMRIEK
ncbi:sodium-translocating pyrophosphatase [Haoranjiania flava]|uniref:K(+)-insensitive pyrophosphate-energized proton pump n=1 Tax=Haoranjiania flava TaxID=1856322 RepID=A0AAE3LJ92_9BACT|nr:sodium-translocating pyrophosphatase [Haoranjiania flava]MCU7693164.1 sodium-translocating pyrophosphatase [Haoranjiania flava]